MVVSNGANDVAPGGGHGPMVQLITCGAGADWACLSDRADRLRKFHQMPSLEGWSLRNGLKAYTSYYRNVPIEEYDETRDIYLDARVFTDPAHGDLRDHNGRHHRIIAGMVGHPAWGDWLRHAHVTLERVFRNWEGGPMLPVVVFCRSGRHRSVAAAEILKYAFVRLKWYKFAPTMHITIDEHLAGCRCQECERDRPVGESIETSVASAVALLQSIALEESRASAAAPAVVALQAASPASPSAVPCTAGGRRKCVCEATWRGWFCWKCGTQH